MKLLLDTHIWLWWINAEDHLPSSHRQQIAQAEVISISVISAWELVMLHKRGRIQLPDPMEIWFNQALQGSGISCLPCSITVATRAATLPAHHRDPADRFIIATALEYGYHLMSFDNKFILYEELQGWHIR